MKLVIFLVSIAYAQESPNRLHEQACVAGLENLSNPYSVCNENEENNEICKETLCEMGCEDFFLYELASEWEAAGGYCGLRTLVGNGVPEDFDITRIMQYGCWCNFDDEDGQRLLLGQGSPVDGYDSICRDYQLCMRCAKSDASNHWADKYNEPLCDPHTESYSTTYNKPTVNALQKSCVDNPTECSKSVCSCESLFATKLFEQNFLAKLLNIPHHNVNPIFQHQTSYRLGGTFDWETQCQRKSTNVVTECCGFYPYRAPYKQTINQQCCGWSNDHVYNPMTQKCVGEGVLDISDEEDSDLLVGDIYLGCYKDQPNRAFPFRAPNFGAGINNARDYCREKCEESGYTHYALQYSRECFCGDETYDMYGKLGEGKCNKPCINDKNVMCGGTWAMGVWKFKH